MDGSKFDDLTRRVATDALSRRGALRLLAGTALSGTLARLSARVAGAACPPDQVNRRRAPSGSGCVCKSNGRPPAGGVCPCPTGQVRCGGVCVDLRRHAEHCGACGAACPAPEPGTCQRQAVCRGGVCEPRPAQAGTVCRPATGPCDVAEVCDGTSFACPPDAFVGAGVVCRPAAGDCDVEEICTGGGPDCPPDAFLGPDVVCRAAAGPCDLAERCPGTGPDCNFDLLRGPDDVCQAADACHAAAFCAGDTVNCPTRVTLSNDAPCVGQNGVCCNGTCRPCCNNNHAQCDDGDPCTIDTCDGTTCRYAPTCDDKNPCTDNNCDPLSGICTYPNKPDRTACNFPGNVCCAGVCALECCDVSDCDHIAANPCVQAACLGGQCTSFPIPDIEGERCGENRTCRVIDNVMRCLECETAAECPAPTNVCKRAVCDPTGTCTEEVRQFEVCGEGATCNVTGDCICTSSASCSSGQVVGNACGGGDCICARTVEDSRICVSCSNLVSATVTCGSRPDCRFAGPQGLDLGFCFFDPCRQNYFCAQPCGLVP